MPKRRGRHRLQADRPGPQDRRRRLRRSRRGRRHLRLAPRPAASRAGWAWPRTSPKPRSPAARPAPSPSPSRCASRRMFSERISLVFKKLRVVRMVDKARNTLVYLTFSDRVIEARRRTASPPCRWIAPRPSRCADPARPPLEKPAWAGRVRRQNWSRPLDRFRPASPMKITAARVIVCCPGRNFCVTHSRSETDQGLTGLGDATLNGRGWRWRATSPTTSCPCLIGSRRPPDRGHLVPLFGAYWRRGPVTAMARSPPSTPRCGTSKARKRPGCRSTSCSAAPAGGVMVYGHASGRDIAQTVEEVLRYKEAGHKAIPRAERRAGAGEGLRRGARHDVLRAGPMPTCPASTTGRPKYLRHTPQLFEAVRAAVGPDVHLLHDAPPPHAHRGRRGWQGSGAVPPVLDGRRHAGREPGGVQAHPPAHDHAAGGGRGLQHRVGLQGPDPEPADRLHPGYRSCTRAASRTCGASPISRRCIRCAPATAPPTSPVCMGAALHFDLWVPNFGIQDTCATATRRMRCSRMRTRSGRLPCTPARCRATMSRSTRRWRQSTYQRAYLPVNRQQHDGTLWHW